MDESLELQIESAGLVVVAWGAGDDSTGMICEMVRRGLRIDLILFADTGAELGKTYAFVPIFERWLLERGYPGVTIVRDIYKRDKTLRGQHARIQDVMARNVTLPPPAFGYKTCSIRFKIEPQDEFLAAYPPAQDAWARGKKVLKLIGYDAGEMKRACNSDVYKETEKFSLAYPLIEWGINREACQAAARAAGLEPPGKSACYFCPHRKKHEIVELAKNEPALFAAAIQLEDAVRAKGTLKSTKGLGRTFAWRDYAEEIGILKKTV